MPEATQTRVDTADVLAIDATVARTSGAPGFGVTPEGFVPKPFARLLAEKLALARSLFGEELDLTSASAIRKVLEISALEDARTWAALATMYENQFVVSATGEALSRLGTELGFPRPHLEASGKVKLRLDGNLPQGVSFVTIPRGARMLSSGGHHVATLEAVKLSTDAREQEIGVEAFYPGSEHNLNPAIPEQKIDRWHPLDPDVSDLIQNQVKIDHAVPFTGGDLLWPDNRYRALILQAPRSIWTVDAFRIAISLVPGVRRVQVRDGWGGLDIYQSIFGNFNFIERVFSSERELGSPYYFTVLVAKTAAAIWEGTDGLRTSVINSIEDLRPIGIFPQVEQADEVAVGISADLLVKGIPLPSGTRATVNSSPAARELKRRLLDRVRRYVESLDFGEPVRAAEITWSLLNEPGIADVRDLKLLRFPPNQVPGFLKQVNISPTPFDCGKNVDLQMKQIATFVDDDSGLTII